MTNSGRADFTEVVILWFLNAERKKERLKGILCRSDSEYDGRGGWQPPHVWKCKCVQLARGLVVQGDGRRWGQRGGLGPRRGHEGETGDRSPCWGALIVSCNSQESTELWLELRYRLLPNPVAPDPTPQDLTQSRCSLLNGFIQGGLGANTSLPWRENVLGAESSWDPPGIFLQQGFSCCPVLN